MTSCGMHEGRNHKKSIVASVVFYLGVSVYL